MAHQRHDVGRQKLADREALPAKKRRPRPRNATFANWCRTRAHPPSCSCGYPAAGELVELQRALDKKRRNDRRTRVDTAGI